jgi:hypothetical protein
MRILLAIAFAVVLAVPSYAQAPAPQKNRSGFNVAPDAPKPQVDEKAYERAVRGMGSGDQTYDPWQNMREQSQAKDTQPKDKTRRSSAKP